MRYSILLLLFFKSFVSASEPVSKIELENEILTLEKELVQSKDKSSIQSKLACRYYQDQSQEKAFKVFLDALKPANLPNASMSKEESAVYIEALTIYHNPSKTPNEIAEEIRSKYQAIGDRERSWYHLGYLLAVADANAGNFVQFFDRFFNSYSHVPNHFLAKKAQAVLHIKLLEKAPTPQDQKAHRDAIVHFIHEAIALEPKDHTLYRYLISFTDHEKRGEAVRSCLNKIISNNIITPRTDILFYVQQAKESGQQDLAKRYLEKAKEWYKVSRFIQTAEKYLEGA